MIITFHANHPASVDSMVQKLLDMIFSRVKVFKAK